MDRYETDAKYNLAETCCASISLNDLMTFGSQETELVDFAQKQIYGARFGDQRPYDRTSQISIQPITPTQLNQFFPVTF